MAETTLVSMPYASITRPSMGLGILKSTLAEAGLDVAVEYANLRFAEHVGLRLYHLPSRLPTQLLAGEWTFAPAAFGDRAPSGAGFEDELIVGEMRRLLEADGRGWQESMRDLHRLREEAMAYVEILAHELVEAGPRIIGCTSTFEQHVASLALLRRVRELDPEIVTMLGGANCESVMGLATHRCFEWVDYVVSGEADRLIVGLCEVVLDKGARASAEDLPPGVLGPCHRVAAPGSRSRMRGMTRATFNDLDSLPVPDFDEYFELLDKVSISSHIRPGVPVETSRGCWWGARHHCTFCGLNGSSMSYRSKRPERVLAELAALEARYGIHDFEVVDNILDSGYYKTVLPSLAQDEIQRRLFYEIKANVGEHHVKQLVDAGVIWVQPGIESLHSDVLRLMDKGIQAWKNIQLLKWSRESGLRLSWALLWGFPGEEDAWYDEIADLCPELEHLQPPGNIVRLRYDRFSVYEDRAEAFGLDLHAVPSMSHIYPLEPAELDELSYYFNDLSADAGPAERPGIDRCRAAVAHWRAEFSTQLPPVLVAMDRGERTEILDTRAVAPTVRRTLHGTERLVCRAVEAAPPEHAVGRAVAERFGVELGAEEIAAAVQTLIDGHLAVRVDDRVVGLTLRSSLPRLPKLSDFPGGFVDT